MKNITPSTAIQEEAVRWAFFHDLFRDPTQQQWKWLNSDPVQQAWTVLSAQYAEGIPQQMPLPDSFEKYHQEYLAVFEVGAPSPPCPLIESHWNKRDSTPRILHENMLFYRQFGLELRSSANETADHLRHQLEFIHHILLLAQRYIEGHSKKALLDQIAQAKKDYIERHLLSWIPTAAESCRKVAPDLWAAQWILLLDNFVKKVQR